MKRLLYKELRLAAHPTLYIFILLGCLVLAPNYPYSTIFLYGCLAPYITFCNGRENHDITYTAALPIKKCDVVKGKYMLFIMAELLQIIVSMLFAFLRFRFGIHTVLGMEVNISYYGFGFLIFAVFNLIFFTTFYKDAYRVGRAFVFAMFPALLLMILMECIAHIPALSWMSTTDTSYFIYQLPVLGIGILCYVIMNLIAYRIAIKRFEQVDL